MSPVRRRCVFYVSGFDPKGASHYHALYREQSQLQAKAGGLQLEVGPRRRLPGGNSCWDVRADDAGLEVRTHYEFVRWDDVVRSYWPRSQWQLWRDVFSTTAFNLRNGALWKMYKLSWPPALALFMPFLLLCGMLAGIPLLAGAAAWLALQTGGGWLPAMAIAVLTGLGLAWLGRRMEARYSMYWMMRSYAFTRRQAQGRTPDLESRLDEQAARLAQRLREREDEEVLVVGHSSGAMMAASIVARALRLGASGGPDQPALSLLTLGQWIPSLGLLPQATEFRAELSRLAMAPGLAWTDFSAPPDGCCFALTDPVAGSGLDISDRAPGRPKLLSPRFAEMFDAPAYQTLRRDKFRMHFQYLMASQRPARYDYFAITAGAKCLADAFADLPGVVDYTGLRLFVRS